jgi:hypothetical protein
MKLIKIKLINKARRINSERIEPGSTITIPYDEARYLLSKKWAVIVKDEPKKPTTKAKK